MKSLHRLHRRALCAVIAFLGALAAAPAAIAQATDYPNKPIKILVGFPAGGAVDILGRLVGQKLQEQMGQAVVVENRPGANGNLATEVLVKQPPDGYTLMIGGSGLSANPPMYPNAGFNIIRDTVPVAYVGYSPLLMVVPNAFPAKNLKEMIDRAKAQPGSVSYASSGNGSSAHMSSEMLKLTAKVDLLHVPYKGGAPALVDLMADRVSFMMLDPAQSMPHMKSQKLRALAIGSAQRSPLMPEVPTFAESGYPDYRAQVWWGIVVPAKTPPEIVAKLNTEINKALVRPEVAARLTELGVVADPKSSAEFGNYMRAELDKWTNLVKVTGMKGE